MNEDAIIANRPHVLEQVAVTLPGGTELGKEARDLLAPVAWPRLREPANRVVVAVGFPESRDPRQDLVQRQGFQSPLPVASRDLHVLLRHRPRSISRRSAAFHAKQEWPSAQLEAMGGGHAA